VGSVTSRALDALNVTPIMGAPTRLTGADQRVGILSNSLARTIEVRDFDTQPPACLPGTLTGSNPQETGDLPAQVDIRADNGFALACPRAGANTDEGAAMVELVHDLAPDAAISFHTAGDSLAAFADGIDDLCTPLEEEGAGSSVVVDDVIFFAELMYQPDIIAQAVTRCAGQGIPYFSAAGNSADQAFRDTYTDLDPDDNDDDASDADREGIPEEAVDGDFHAWAGGDGYLGITLDPGERFRAILQWNQPALSVPQNAVNGPQVDLDLFVFDRADAESAAVLARSTQDQQASDAASGADPIEIVFYENTDEEAETVYLAVDHWAGSRSAIPQDADTPLELRLVFFSDGTLEFEHVPSAPTMYGHALAAGGISVAAVPWFDTPAFDPSLPPTAVMDPEPFTATGGVLPQSFAADGRFQEATWTGPDLAAVDGNNTTFFGQPSDTVSAPGEPDGFPNFFGTSAAAPNAAGVTALLLQYADGVAPADMEAVLEKTAVDVTGERAAPGADDVTGAGLVDAAAALAEFPTADAGPDQTVVGSSLVTLDGSGSTDNNGIVSFTWSQFSGPSVELSDPGAMRPTFRAPDTATTLDFKLSVEDADGLTHADRTTVSVIERPLADAGPDQTVAPGDEVTLDGSNSTDPDGSITSYAWVQTSGPEVALTGADQAQASFTAPDAEAELIFELTVTDGDGLKDSDTTTVSVRVDEDDDGGGGATGPLFLALMLAAEAYRRGTGATRSAAHAGGR